MAMGTYWPHKPRGKKHHHIHKPQRPSQSTGKSKGISTPPEWRTICRRNRSYKSPIYNMVMSKLNGEKRRGKSKCLSNK